MTEQSTRNAVLLQLRQIRFFVLVGFLGLLIILAVQNIAALEVQFLFWTFESRRIVILASSLGVGLIIGWLFGYTQRPKH